MGSSKSHRSEAAQAMQHNRRMARTLGCLVASMTIGAALLDWVQPKHLPAASVRTELMSVLRQGTRPGEWRGIQVDPQTSATDRTPAHFLIDRDGSATVTELWESQRPVGSEGVVRIGVVASDNSNQVTHAQLAKANELVRLLQHACSIGNEQIHYDMLAVSPAPLGATGPSGSSPPSRTARQK